ncbi:helicase C-terminal domain-containing protein [Desulfolucanica intricata]|uniref:helicase C-terminal domain-containing protein n=1 Tax=Desulfolucanica intricata TaxID=1285191 RepID=UPI0008296924|nr:helicase C-terminal domain-containing protein [Desulfolucanica intricata]
MLGNFVICYFITTGKDPLKDEIIETGLVRTNNREIIETTHYYSKPSHKLPVQVKTITGLNDEFFIDKPGFDKLIPNILDFIGDATLICHDAGLTYTFLSATIGYPLPNLYLDTKILSKILLPALNNYRLNTIYKNLFSSEINSRRADQMALATAKVFIQLCETYQDLNSNQLIQLNNILDRSIENSHISFIKSLTKKAIKNFAYHKIFTHNTESFLSNSIYEDRQSLFYEYNDESGEAEPGPINYKQVRNVLGPGGKLAQTHPHYEHRPQQLKMAKAVTEALNNKTILLTEAGTGTGKSMAYLVPAVFWAVQNEKRVVVSTHTIHLQEQLWFKDIPLLKQLLPMTFRAALIKGRQNYLCLRRWSELLSITDNWYSTEALFFCRITVWLMKTETGDRSELNLSKAENDWWAKISADSDSCNGPRCKWFHRTCFITRAKKLAERSNLIIINHSLLCSDLQSENRILPSYGPLIVDEAHHLENVATKHFGYSTSEAAVKQWLNTTEKLIHRLAQTAAGNDDGNWDQIIYTTRKAREDTYRASETLFKLLKTIIPENSAPGANVKRLDKNNLINEDDFTIEIDNLKIYFKSLLSGLKKLLLRIEARTAQHERWVNMVNNLSIHISLGTQHLLNLDFILSRKDCSFVYWMEAYHFSNYTNLILIAVPINVGRLLYEKLFTHKKPIILTSATLTIERTFDFFKQCTGLNFYTGQILQLQVDSPFNYSKQAQLFLASDLPNQNEVSEQFYYSNLANIIKKLVLATQGKSLVLFTSHKSLKEIYNRLKPVLEELDILLLGHNIDGSRSSLIEEFKCNPKSVLFGTASFWEGVDVPGESLISVIIVKLPFWSPSIPVIEARLEHLAKQGKSGFWEFSLPQAVIRLKQGFGRLIRSSRDHGVVIILDKRIIQKNYGSNFLNSLPLKQHQRGNINSIIPKINNWLNKYKDN